MPRADRWALLPWACVGLWCALVGAALALEAATGRSVVTCTFKRCTGLPCPSCGSTRAMLAAARGDVLGAVAWNPLFTLAPVALVLVLGVRRLGGRDARIARRERSHWRAAVALLALVGANWAYVLWHGN